MASTGAAQGNPLPLAAQIRPQGLTVPGRMTNGRKNIFFINLTLSYTYISVINSRSPDLLNFHLGWFGDISPAPFCKCRCQRSFKSYAKFLFNQSDFSGLCLANDNCDGGQWGRTGCGWAGTFKAIEFGRIVNSWKVKILISIIYLYT